MHSQLDGTAGQFHWFPASSTYLSLDRLLTSSEADHHSMEAAPSGSAPGPVPAPDRSAQFFRGSSRIDIEGSHLVNAARDVNFHLPPSAVLQRPPAETHTMAGDTQYTPSQCYCNQLLHQERGFPLYVPAPLDNLPADYKRKGVSIGDVGTVTPQGVFRFFFNIYLPADHPINDNDVPDNFSPLTKYDSKSVVLRNYLPEDFVSTPDSVERLDLPTDPQREFQDFFFEGNGSQGALLAIPFGSRFEKLGDGLQQMTDYARANAESWYQHSNGTRGRQLPNGSLYLITGWEKARAWGMASFQNAAARSPFRLGFQSVLDGSTSAYKYWWTASAPARTQTSGQIPAKDVPLNQTVFIHGYSISLGAGIWHKLFNWGVDISQIADCRPGQTNRDYIPFGSQGFSFSWSFGFLSGGGSPGGKQHDSEDPSSMDAVKISDLVPVQNFFHPSQVINDYMLQKFPDAAVVMSHDVCVKKFSGLPISYYMTRISRGPPFSTPHHRYRPLLRAKLSHLKRNKPCQMISRRHPQCRLGGNTSGEPQSCPSPWVASPLKSLAIWRCAGDPSIG
ncbi:hypothetical protein FB45DRAFT_1464 [Roridomyces roridus]|uniref:Uncharacterized protein n=1 Tax=Roridomyces roridus TaxID=1738132 RepID=A0AAD7CHV9_9AGAR|nr:hypothetical protein FB45DRAFT_1464 [Roridomyces roridus]